MNMQIEHDANSTLSIPLTMEFVIPNWLKFICQTSPDTRYLPRYSIPKFPPKRTMVNLLLHRCCVAEPQIGPRGHYATLFTTIYGRLKYLVCYMIFRQKCGILLENWDRCTAPSCALHISLHVTSTFSLNSDLAVLNSGQGNVWSLNTLLCSCAGIGLICLGGHTKR